MFKCNVQKFWMLCAVVGASLSPTVTAAIAENTIGCRYDGITYSCVDSANPTAEVSFKGDAGTSKKNMNLHVRVTCEEWSCTDSNGEYYGSAYSGYDYVVQHGHLLVVYEDRTVASPFTPELQKELLEMAPQMDNWVAGNYGYDEATGEYEGVPDTVVDDADTVMISIYDVNCHPIKDTCIYDGEYIEKPILHRSIPLAEVTAPKGDWWECEYELCYLSTGDVFGTSPYYEGWL